MPVATYQHPGASNVHLVRWYLGDTQTNGDTDAVVDPLVTDLEIIFALQQKSDNAKAAAAFCARYAATKLIHEPQSVRLLDFSASSGGSTAKEIADRYLKLAEQLEREDKRAGIYAGGISVTGKEANEANTDIVQPAFKRGIHDFDPGWNR